MPWNRKSYQTWRRKSSSDHSIHDAIDQEHQRSTIVIPDCEVSRVVIDLLSSSPIRGDRKKKQCSADQSPPPKKRVVTDLRSDSATRGSSPGLPSDDLPQDIPDITAMMSGLMSDQSDAVADLPLLQRAGPHFPPPKVAMPHKLLIPRGHSARSSGQRFLNLPDAPTPIPHPTFRAPINSTPAPIKSKPAPTKLTPTPIKSTSTSAKSTPTREHSASCEFTDTSNVSNIFFDATLN